ncbi:MAG TPA: hypothetical protein VIJ25_13630, partial [Methylococcales bacterium]
MKNQYKRCVLILSLLLPLTFTNPAISHPTPAAKLVNYSKNQPMIGGERDDIFFVGNCDKTATPNLIADFSEGTDQIKVGCFDPQYELLAKGIYLYFDNLDYGNGQFRPQVLALLDEQGYAIDRVFDDPNTSLQALGLRSKDGSKPPVLVFQGSATAQASADAGDSATNADPKGIGFSQFFANQQAIQDWLVTITNDQEHNPQGFKPDVTGQSLGGALTQWTASELPTFIGSAASFQSPGIARDAARKFIENGGKPNQVRHYIVDGDIVSLLGEAFIPGKVVVSTFEANEAEEANYFARKHQSGILADFRSVISEPSDPATAQLLAATSRP